MNFSSFLGPVRRVGIAAAAAFLGLFAGVPVHAQSVTVDGRTCTYSSFTVTPPSNYVFTTGSCTGGSTTASVSIGAVQGSLTTSGSSSATMSVSCSGACTGVTVDAAVNSPGSGVTAASTVTNGAGTIEVNGLGPLAAGSASIGLSGTGPTGITISLSRTTASVPIVDASAPGTLGFASSTSTGTDSGLPVAIVVSRAGAGSSAPGVTVDYSCAVTSGFTTALPTFSPAAAGTFSWAGTDATSKTISVTPAVLPTGTGTGSVTCTLSNATGGASLGTASHALTFTKLATNPGPGSCPTAADVSYDMGDSSIRQIVQMNGLKTASIQFKPVRTGTPQGKISLSMPVPGITSLDANGLEVAIAECPNDFSRSLGTTTCGFKVENSMQVTLYWTTINKAGRCKLDPAKTYQVNIKFTRLSGATSCPYTNCGVFTDWTWTE